MTDRIRKALGDLKARQDAGEHMPCPRCGRDTMKENIHTNALSRHADIYICDACGVAEAQRRSGDLQRKHPSDQEQHLR